MNTILMIYCLYQNVTFILFPFLKPISFHLYVFLSYFPSVFLLCNVVARKSMYSPSLFLCNTAAMAFHVELSGRLSHTDECVSVKEPEWLSLLLAQGRNKRRPPTPVRKLAQAPPIGHKHHRFRRTNSLRS